MRRISNYKPYVKRPIFQYQCVGDNSIDNVLPTSILFCGETKVGKTNLFEYIKGTPMIGKKKNGHIVYEKMV